MRNWEVVGSMDLSKFGKLLAPNAPKGHKNMFVKI